MEMKKQGRGGSMGTVVWSETPELAALSALETSVDGTGYVFVILPSGRKASYQFSKTIDSISIYEL